MNTKRREEVRKGVEYRKQERERTIEVGDKIKIASKLVRSKLRFI